MNWYRFKIELSAWATKTALATLTTLVALRVLFQPVDSLNEYSVSMRTVADNEWAVQLGFGLAVVLLWLCYWRIFSIYRGHRAYKKN